MLQCSIVIFSHVHISVLRNVTFEKKASSTNFTPLFPKLWNYCKNKQAYPMWE